jgi:antitoxin component HigA of HigAB toxin-antitoxin module
LLSCLQPEAAGASVLGLRLRGRRIYIKGVGEETGTLTISPKSTGDLLAKALPRVIGNDSDLTHFSELLESLDRLGRELSPEEKTLEVLLSRLIEDYDQQIEIPELPAHKTIEFLMRQKDLRRADLLPVFGSRSVASDVLNGKREPGKAHIKKLTDFFRLSPAAFL